MKLNPDEYFDFDGQETRLLRSDMLKAAQKLQAVEIQFLVRRYYEIQEARIIDNNRVRTLQKEEVPVTLFEYLGQKNENMENLIKSWLDHWASLDPMCEWMRANLGIGPVLSSGLRSMIDIEKAPAAGHIYAIAGIQHNSTWLGAEKAKKAVAELNLGKRKIDASHQEALAKLGVYSIHTIRNKLPEGSSEKDAIKFMSKLPWNADLKKLMWKISKSFVFVSSNEKPNYGKFYKQRKAYETAKNANGLYADYAAITLERYKFGKDTEAYGHYSQGFLSPAHIEARARRYAVKLFISHLHEVWYAYHYEKPAPLPYVFAHKGHVDYIPPLVTWRPEKGKLHSKLKVTLKET